MWLIAGLGNPGSEYAGNRHNIGFMIVEELRRRSGAGWKEKFSGKFARAAVGGAEAVLLCPMTFMNLSGHSVQKASAFFGIAPEQTLVVHDELDLPWRTVRVKQGGGAGGHNGLRSILEQLGSDSFARVRAGIGRPPQGDAEGYVLSNFSAIERAELPDVLTRGADAAAAVVNRGVTAAMNEFNRRSTDEDPETGR